MYMNCFLLNKNQIDSSQLVLKLKKLDVNFQSYLIKDYKIMAGIK